MIPGRVFIAASLDGFIARTDGDIEWLLGYSDKGEDYGYADFMKTVGGLIMGSASYEKVLGFAEWPYEKPVIVLSSRLEQSAVPEHLADKVRILNLTPREALALAEKEGWPGAYIDGGKLIQSFLREGLIETFTLTHAPVLLGDGLPLFGLLEQDIKLVHLGTSSWDSGLVQSRYRIGRD